MPWRWVGVEAVKRRSWVMVEAKVSVERHNLYRGLGPILNAIAVSPAEAAAEEVATF